ncbi:MAG TPA: hypothetical protein VG604_04395 [Candidatus Saccharimonadales bacterium]|nr:hypothetical protein [Candidatus Saccharimonadales bacterium]
MNGLLRAGANFIVVFMSIVLFMAPFYAVFRWRQRSDKQLSGNLNLSVERFFGSRQANWLVLFWAAGEATFWFVIPEFLLLLMIFMRVHRKFQLVIWDIYGTVIGTAIAFWLHLSHASLLRLPYIYPGMIAHVEKWYHHLGIWGLAYQPYSGVPYKVFTFLAPEHHFFFVWFILFAVVVRITRYFISYALLNSLYPVLHRRVYRNYLPLFVGAVLFFSIMLLRISHLYS